MLPIEQYLSYIHNFLAYLAYDYNKDETLARKAAQQLVIMLEAEKLIQDLLEDNKEISENG